MNPFIFFFGVASLLILGKMQLHLYNNGALSLRASDPSLLPEQGSPISSTR